MLVVTFNFPLNTDRKKKVSEFQCILKILMTKYILFIFLFLAKAWVFFVLTYLIEHWRMAGILERR